MENIQEIINRYELQQGAHKSIEEGGCIMEIVSYIANEPWSDHPKCSCPVLTAYAIRLNDRFSHEDRQKLKPLIPKLLNTRDPKKQKERAHFLILQSITVFLPILTDALDLKEISDKLRLFKVGDWKEAKDFIHASRPAIREAASKRAAYADADAAAAAAAYAAAYAAAAADADAYADAYAAAAAYAAAYAAAAAAAYAAAAAAAAAYAAAYAAADADAYADAYAAAKNAPFWREIKTKTIEASIKALSDACDL